MGDFDRDREPDREHIRETDRTTVVTSDGGRRGGGGWVVAALLAVAAIVLLFVFLGRGGVEDAADKVGVNVNVEAPDIKVPDVDVPDNVKVELPDEVKIDTDGNSAQ